MTDIILKASLAGTGFSGKKGQTISVSDEIATDLIKAKLAKKTPKAKTVK